MNILKNVMNKIAESDKKTELASQKVELGIIDDISKLKKESQKFLADSNKSDAAVQKAVAQIKDKAQFWMNNKKFAANLEKRANGLMDKYEKAAKELGLDVKNSPASKEFFEILDIGSQIDDNIQNIASSISSIK